MAEESEPIDEESATKGKEPARKREKKERLRGFAGLIKSQLEAINTIPKFKERFADADIKFLLVATDMYPAALAHVDHGELKFSAVPKEECAKWKKTGAQALLQCTTEQFMGIATGKLDPVKAWVKRQIKLRGPRKLLLLNKIFAIMARQNRT